MDQNINMGQNVDTLFHGLENFTQKEGIIGKPVTQGDKTFIPVVSVTLGYGEGNAPSKNQSSGSSSAMGSSSSSNTGGALGLGAKLSTDAIILIENNTVSMLPVNSAGGNTSQIMDKIPQIVMGMNQNKAQK